MSPADAVFDQILNQVRGELQFIIEKHDLLHLPRCECLTQVLFRDIKKLYDLIILLQFLHPVRSKGGRSRSP